MMKKIIFMLLALLLSFSASVFADEQISVKVNDIKLECKEQAPVIINNRVMVPVRDILEALDADVLWDSKTKTVTVLKDDTEIEMTIDSQYANVNGKKIKLDSPAIILNGKTLVPLRVISENLYCSVSWNQEEKIVNIITEGHASVAAEVEKVLSIKPDISTSYKKVKSVKLPIRIYLPQKNSRNKNTLILVIHGGSWYGVRNTGDDWGMEQMNYQAQYYADKGYTTAVISYRSIDFDEETDVFDLIDDCKDAVSYLKKNVGFDKLIVMGDSAGGHLAVELGLDDEIAPDMVIATNPVLDLCETKWKYTANGRKMRKLASPIYNMKKTNTRFVILHGERDTMVDCEISEEFCDEMKKLGNECKYIEIEKADHAFILLRKYSTDEQIKKYMEMIDGFIQLDD